MSDSKLWEHHQTKNRQHLKSSHQRQEFILKKMKKLLPDPAKVIEIGFGEGYVLNALANMGHDVIGADISAKNIEYTKKQWNNDKIKFKLVDTSGKLDVPDHSFDCFVASEVLEHMDDQELDITISEMQRILKPGGYAFLTFPAKETLQEQECICPDCGKVFHRRGHKQSWDIDKINKLFKPFEIVYTKVIFNRHIGKNFLENLIGWSLYIARNTLKNLIDLKFGTYVVILRKK